MYESNSTINPVRISDVLWGGFRWSLLFGGLAFLAVISTAFLMMDLGWIAIVAGIALMPAVVLAAFCAGALHAYLRTKMHRAIALSASFTFGVLIGIGVFLFLVSKV